MREKLNIRQAETKDLAEIIELGIKLAEQHLKYDQKRFTLTVFEPVRETFAGFFSEQLRNEKAKFLVVELNKHIVGYAFVRVESKSFGDLLAESVWLHDIYLDEKSRGKSIGKQFFEEIIKVAKSLGSDNLMLTVSPKNKIAQKFFEQCGFRLTMQEMRLDFENEE